MKTPDAWIVSRIEHSGIAGYEYRVIGENTCAYPPEAFRWNVPLKSLEDPRYVGVTEALTDLARRIGEGAAE